MPETNLVSRWEQAEPSRHESESDDARSDYEIELSELGAHPSDAAPGGPGRRRTGRSIGVRRWLRRASVVAVAVVGFVAGGRFAAPTAEPDAGDRQGLLEDADKPNDSARSAGATEGALVLPLVESERLADGEGWLAGLVGTDLVRVDLAAQTVRPLDDVEPEPGSQLVAFDGRVSVVADGHAVAVDGAGTTEVLASADVILAATTPDRIWIGRRARDAEASRFDPTDWQLVDADGAVWSTIVRDSPMEYPMPDLVWGFDSSFFRLEVADEPTSATALPASVDALTNAADWERIGTGWPIAVGLRDIIIQSCVREPDGGRGECDVRWYDRSTGEDRGALFSDLAVNFDAWYGGVISPDGRFIARLPDDGSAAEITVVATGEVIASRCTDTERLAWSDSGSRLACATALGFEVSALAEPRGVWRYQTDQPIRALAWGTGDATPNVELESQ